MLKVFNTCCILIFLVFIIKLTNAQNRKCDSTKGDACFNTLMMLTDPNFIYPETIEQMPAHCSKSIRNQNCLKSYIQSCLSNFTKQASKLLIYGVSKTNKIYCSNKRRKQAFIAAGKCLNKVQPDFIKCTVNLMDTGLGIKNEKDDKKKIPQVCCHYHKFRQCLINSVERNNPGTCNDNHETEIGRLIDGFAEDALSFVCGDFSEENDKCTKIINQTPKRLKTQKRPISVYSLFIEILNSIK